jgi:K+/H+ antiporter YhaU regulatory subunit KhtT
MDGPVFSLIHTLQNLEKRVENVIYVKDFADLQFYQKTIKEIPMRLKEQETIVAVVHESCS